MIKVAHVCTAAISHKILLDKLSILNQLGYEVHIISSTEGLNQEMLHAFPNLHFRYIEMSRSIKPIQDIQSIYELCRLLKRERYDIVHTHTAKAGLIGRVAATLCRTKLILHTSHGLPYFQGQPKLQYHLYRLLEKLASYFCHAIGSQNKEDMSKLTELNPRKPVFYEGNGVLLPMLDDIRSFITEEELHELRESYQLSRTHKIIVVGARLEPIKNHQLLIQALDRLKQMRSDFYCLFVGEGPLEDELKQQVIDLKLQSHILFLGFQKNIYSFIKIADVVALSSFKEGIPRIIMEAMAFSKPIVATNVIGTREIVEDEKNGYLVNLEDAEEFAARLNMLLDDQELAHRLGEHGRRRVEDEFTEHLVASRIDTLYQQWLSKNS